MQIGYGYPLHPGVSSRTLKLFSTRSERGRDCKAGSFPSRPGNNPLENAAAAPAQISSTSSPHGGFGHRSPRVSKMRALKACIREAFLFSSTDNSEATDLLSSLSENSSSDPGCSEITSSGVGRKRASGALTWLIGAVSRVLGKVGRVAPHALSTWKSCAQGSQKLTLEGLQHSYSPIKLKCRRGLAHDTR